MLAGQVVKVNESLNCKMDVSLNILIVGILYIYYCESTKSLMGFNLLNQLNFQFHLRRLDTLSGGCNSVRIANGPF